MIKSITIIATLFTIVFSTSRPQSQTQLSTKKATTLETYKEVIVNHEDYTLNISLENTNSNNPVLVIVMELKNKAHFISSMEKKEFSEKFYFDFGSYKDLAFDGKATEIPTAKAKILYPNFKPYGEGILWVIENTIYRQPLHLKNKNDFEVFGRVRFTIEPRCTLEEIPFAISYKDGKMVFIEPKC